MISHPKRDLVLINAAGLVRSFGVGLMGVVLGIYLFRSGLSSTAIGLIIAMGLAGSATATVLMTFAADRMGRKWFLVILSLSSAVGGIALALWPSLPVLAAMAFMGMLNGAGTDRSASFALDQAIVPGLVPDARRTWGLAWYNVLLDGGGSLGASGAGLPLLLQHEISLTILTSYRLVRRGGCHLPVPFPSNRSGISQEPCFSQNWNHTQKQEDRRQDHSIVFAGCLRRRLFDLCTCCLLVFFGASESRNKTWVSFSPRCIS